MVKVSNPEVPDLLFIGTSIDNWKVRIRWVREESFSLDISPIPFFIIIFSWNEGCDTNSSFWIWVCMPKSLILLKLVDRLVIE